MKNTMSYLFNRHNLLNTVFILSAFMLLGLTLQAKPAYAAIKFDNSIPAGALECTCEGAPPFPSCANQQNTSTGVCGYPACGDGNTWYKYNVQLTCYKLSALGTCFHWYL